MNPWKRSVMAHRESDTPEKMKTKNNIAKLAMGMVAQNEALEELGFKVKEEETREPGNPRERRTPHVEEKQTP